jgi:hypothetical protein
VGFQTGDRVRVSKLNGWAGGALGTIAIPPDLVQQPKCEDDVPFQGCRRVVYGQRGPVEFYWVDFDEPQIDSDGDGPYRGAEIPTSMIEGLPETDPSG